MPGGFDFVSNKADESDVNRMRTDFLPAPFGPECSLGAMSTYTYVLNPVQVFEQSGFGGRTFSLSWASQARPRDRESEHNRGQMWKFATHAGITSECFVPLGRWTEALVEASIATPCPTRPEYRSTTPVAA